VDEAELRQRLKPILKAEEKADWETVDRLSDDLNRELMEHRSTAPEIVDHYLDDADIRQNDSRYGEDQRRKVRLFIDTGEYDSGTRVPLWSCALVLTLVVAAAIWLSK
jgi:hypothetical protein